MNGIAYYEATAEQVQSWAYHMSLGDDQQHQVLTIDSVVEKLDAGSLERAFTSMVRRHDSLRTFFRIVDGSVKQCVMDYDPATFSPAWYDMTAGKDRQALIGEINGAIVEWKWRLRAINRPPLLKCCVFTLPDGKHYLCVLIHHIISDEWSASLLHRELVTLYESYRAGSNPKVGPLPIQLKDYARWQREWLKDNGDQVRCYWKTKLGRIEDTLNPEDLYRQHRLLSGLPREKDEGAVIAGLTGRERLLRILETGKGASYAFHIGSAGYERLLALSEYCNVSIWVVLNASLQLLFYMLSGREEPTIAMSVISRHLPGAESLIGCLMGGVYLHRPVNEDLSIRDFIGEVFCDFLESAVNIIWDHAEMEVDEETMRLRTDVFSNFVNKEIVGKKSLYDHEDRVHQALPSPLYYALSYTILECPDGLLAYWKYNSQLYSPERIENMARCHEALWQAICDSPSMLVKEWMRDSH